MGTDFEEIQEGTVDEELEAAAAPLLRALVDLRDRQIQKARIQFRLRQAAAERSADSVSEQQRKIIDRWHDRFTELEKELDRDIRRAVDEYPIYAELSQVKGIGPIMSAKLIALIDIHRAETVSALWRFAGLAVIDGERERSREGEKRHYNVRLKTTLYLIAGSFLKANSPYRAVYDDAKAYYQANRTEWSKIRVHRAALRKMEKMFLSHLWERWRTLEGLPTRALYVEEKLGHTHVRKPSEFGWPH